MGDTGNFVITSTYLTDFAKQQIQSFLDDVKNNQTVLQLYEFANGTPGGSGTYGQILPGNVSVKNVSPSAQLLQDGFKNLSGSLQSQVTNLHDFVGKLQNDLLTVNDVLNGGEDAANITAAEMATALGDVLPGAGSPGSPGPSGSTPGH